MSNTNSPLSFIKPNTSKPVSGFIKKNHCAVLLGKIDGMLVFHHFDKLGEYERSERAWHYVVDETTFPEEDFVLPEIYEIKGKFGAIGPNLIDKITVYKGYVISYHSGEIIWGRKSPDFHVFEPYTDDM